MSLNMLYQDIFEEKSILMVPNSPHFHYVIIVIV